MSPNVSADEATYDGVRVVGDNGMALRCSIGERELWIGKLQMQPGTTISRVGDCGRLVLKRWMLTDLGLEPPPS